MNNTSGFISSANRGLDCQSTCQKPDIREQLTNLTISVEMLEKSVERAASMLVPVLNDGLKQSSVGQDSPESVPSKTGLGREIQGIGERVSRMARAINHLIDDTEL